MGNSNGKKALTGGDLEFLREHTSITHDDQAMYENFIVKVVCKHKGNGTKGQMQSLSQKHLF